jgi:hypothetical protein
MGDVIWLANNVGEAAQLEQMIQDYRAGLIVSLNAVALYKSGEVVPFVSKDCTHTHTHTANRVPVNR